MNSILRTAWKWFWGAVALSLVAAAVLLTVARLALPFASEYRAEIEEHLSGYLGVPLTIGHLDIEWHGLGPRLRAESLRITGPPGYPSARVERAYLDLDLAWPSAANRLPLRLEGVSLVGIEAQVALDERGRPASSGITVGGARRPAPDVAGRLLGVERLQLRDARITVEQPGREPVVLTNAEIRVLNRGGRHRVAASADLPPSHGGRLHAALDLRGPMGDYAQWRGAGYLRGTDLDLSAWPRPWRRGGELDGRGDAELWARWSDGGLQKLQADARLRDLETTGERDAHVALERLAGRFAWTRTAGGWRVDGADVEVERGGRAWRTDGFSVARSAKEGVAPQWRGQVGFARLEDVLAVARAAPLPPAMVRALEQYTADRELRGGLRDLAFRGSGRDDFALRATGVDLGWSAGGSMPGASGLDGQLAFGPAGGAVELFTASASLRAPKLFRGPLTIADLRGRLELARSDDGIRVRTQRLQAANGDLRATARLDLRLPGEGKPRVDLQVDLAEGDVAAVSRYLPVGVMKPKVVEWLDRALLAGRVAEGRVLWRGPVADFPHVQAGGVFDVALQVDDVRLDYAPDWPGLLEGDGRVRLSGRSTVVETQRARLFDTDIGALEARIDDFADARLQVRTRAHGPLADLVRVVNASPLERRLGQFFGDARAGGAAGLELDLSVPLRRPQDTRASGRVHLSGNHFAQPRFGLDLEQLDGSVRFADERLTIAGLSARLRGQPVRIDARTRPAPEKMLLIGIQGELGAEALLPGLADAIAERIDGRAPWHLQVQVPFESGDGERSILLRGTSGLVGTAIDLPAPLGKRADERRPLHFEIPVAPGGGLGSARLTYAGQLQANLDLAGRRGDLELERGDVRFGDGPAAPVEPEAPGIRVRGRLGEVDLGAWADVVRAAQEGAAAASPGGAFDAVGLARADLHLARVTYRGHGVTDLRLQATREAASWRVDLDSAALAGRASVPAEPGPGSKPLRLRLARLDWAALAPADAPDGNDNPGGSPPDPAALPPLDLRIDRLGLDSGALHDVVVVTAPLPNGLAIRRAEFNNPHLGLEADGRWRGARTAQTAQTALRLTLRSDDLGAAMATLGHGGIIARGNGRVTANLQWPGAPWAPTLADVDGQLDLRVREGVLKSVDPGVARLFGPLDVKGMLQSGFQFDALDGRIDLAGGYASTDKLTLEGPVGRLTVRGRTGLVDRTHDHTIVYRPELSRSLPVIGALSGGPATGLAVALVQSALRNLGADVETAAEVTYTLTGAWDDPNVERVTTVPTRPSE